MKVTAIKNLSLMKIHLQSFQAMAHNVTEILYSETKLGANNNEGKTAL